MSKAEDITQLPISSSWTSEGGPHGASHSFLFTLVNIYGTVPTIFPNLDKWHSTYNGSQYNPIFGHVGNTHDLYIANNFLFHHYSYSDFSLTYKDVLGKGKSIFTGDPNNNNKLIIIVELEVFKLFN